MKSVTLTACAKVNLYLDVLRKLPDGYHELVTLFERIDLHDELSVEVTSSSGLALTCDDPSLAVDSTNLVVRAAEAFRRLAGWNPGLRIHLKKKIPMGGGMGGGSSNAAVTLLALQKLSGGVLPKEKLISCACALGADAAFFVGESSYGLGRGRGDEIEPLSCSARFWHLLVTPDFPIPTKTVYQHFELTAPPKEVAPLTKALQAGTVSSVRDLLYNALEPVVEGLYPRIRQVKSEMEAAGLKRPMVSGSGSTVFALCDSKEDAEQTAGNLRKKQPHWRVFTAETA